MPQRMKDFGRQNLWRIYQTITTTGDLIEGTVLVPATETNMLEIVAQNWKAACFEGRNADVTDTTTFKIYGSRKYMESVPATGDSFWTPSGAHWTLLDTQATVTASTNTTAVVHENKNYTYYLVTAQAAPTKDTLTICRAVLSQN